MTTNTTSSQNEPKEGAVSTVRTTRSAKVRGKRSASSKSAAARTNPGTVRKVKGGGFDIPVGDTGEVMRSAWHFGE